jgi:hypothetical protein
MTAQRRTSSVAPALVMRRRRTSMMIRTTRGRGLSAARRRHAHTVVGVEELLLLIDEHALDEADHDGHHYRRCALAFVGQPPSEQEGVAAPHPLRCEQGRPDRGEARSAGQLQRVKQRSAGAATARSGPRYSERPRILVAPAASEVRAARMHREPR